MREKNKKIDQQKINFDNILHSKRLHLFKNLWGKVQELAPLKMALV